MTAAVNWSIPFLQGQAQLVAVKIVGIHDDSKAKARSVELSGSVENRFLWVVSLVEFLSIANACFVDGRSCCHAFLETFPCAGKNKSR